MSNIAWFDEEFIDSHLHQLRTSLSIIEMALFSLPKDSASWMIASSSKLIEASYEDLLLIKNFQYIQNQAYDSINIADFLGERLEYFESCFHTYEIEIQKEIQSKEDLKLDSNEEFLKRLIDTAIVFLIKNTKPQTKIYFLVYERGIEISCDVHNEYPKFKDSSKKIIEIIEKNSKLSLKQEFEGGQKLKLKIVF